MNLSYTYWQEQDGWYVGYWNDYPDYPTQGETLDELKRMLLSLRSDIRDMVADGTMVDSPRTVGVMEFV